MYILDLIIALPILYFGYKGAVNGLVKEVLNIVGITLAVFLTFNYMDAFATLIEPFMADKEAYIPFVSGAILFLGTLIIVGIIAVLTKKFLEAVNLGKVNRAFGALFGVLKAGIIISTALLLLSGFNLPSEETRNESILYPYVIQLGPWTYEAIALVYPGAENFTDTIKENISKYNPAENLPILNND
ncbi:CvpA family protein [Balneola vulgaris]|jgi:membrane protein required for colicin V production|uniref:CvpA family protein n=1 Tax=Balneola vulgaris TaxID=287535 RepID=UPI000365AAF7|nr:CvpA family protein [Balneola vulgaris]